MKLNQNTNYNGLLLVWTRVREKKKVTRQEGRKEFTNMPHKGGRLFKLIRGVTEHKLFSSHNTYATNKKT
jgi:uncharacterized membrane protein